MAEIRKPLDSEEIGEIRVAIKNLSMTMTRINTHIKKGENEVALNLFGKAVLMVFAITKRMVLLAAEHKVQSTGEGIGAWAESMTEKGEGLVSMINGLKKRAVSQFEQVRSHWGGSISACVDRLWKDDSTYTLVGTYKLGVTEIIEAFKRCANSDEQVKFHDSQQVDNRYVGTIGMQGSTWTSCARLVIGSSEIIDTASDVPVIVVFLKFYNYHTMQKASEAPELVAVYLNDLKERLKGELDSV